MADRTVENETLGVPQIDETLEILLLQSIEQAQQMMEQGNPGDGFLPFTALLVGDKVITEEYEGTTDECFEAAQRTVEGATGARAYVLCYDGYIEAEEGDKDAIIAEGGIPAAVAGVAVGLMYEEGEEGIDFDEEVCYIAEAPNFLATAEEASDIIEDEEEGEDAE